MVLPKLQNVAFVGGEGEDKPLLSVKSIHLRLLSTCRKGCEIFFKDLDLKLQSKSQPDRSTENGNCLDEGSFQLSFKICVAE